MARGWESKGIESQIEDARHKRSERKESDDELLARRQRESLETSRRRIVAELETTKSPVYREALQHALAHLDAQLCKPGEKD